MYSDSYDTSGGCTRVSGVERMLIRKISDVEKFTKNSRRFMCRRFDGIRDTFFCASVWSYLLGEMFMHHSCNQV